MTRKATERGPADGARRRGRPLSPPAPGAARPGAGLAAAAAHRLPRRRAGDRPAPGITLFTTILKPTDPLRPSLSPD